MLKLLFSNKVTIILLSFFAISMGVSTFIENDFGTSAARITIYETWWFELILLLLALNFCGNIFKYKLFKKEKFTTLLFHTGFIIIILGAFITRYTNFEGMMRIREGATSNIAITQQKTLSIKVSQKNKIIFEKKQILNLSILNQPSLIFFPDKTNPKLIININKFVPDAEQNIVSGKEDEEVIEIVIPTDDGRKNIFLQKGKFIFLGENKIGFNYNIDDGININSENENYYITATDTLNYIIMSNQKKGYIPKNTKNDLFIRSLYTYKNNSFVISNIHQKSKVDYVQTEDKELKKTASDLLFINIKLDKQNQEIIMASQDGVYSPEKIINLDDYQITLFYGPTLVEIPFNIKLIDFQLERYPGSITASSYASEIMVQDKQINFPYRIYMNNVLDYRGYRFYQASYDNDEKGTVLSINKDFWGTNITYLGYFILFLGMILNIFHPKSRFQYLIKELNKLPKITISIIFILFFNISYSQSKTSVNFEELQIIIPSKEHSAEFGRLITQDIDGRMKPINTLASEFLRKLYRKTNFTIKNGDKITELDCNQFFISFIANPEYWQYIPLIHIDTKAGIEILAVLGKNKKTNLLSFSDFLDKEGKYKLDLMVQNAQQKKPSARSIFDNEIIKINERFDILFQGLLGNYLKIFPIPNDKKQSWTTHNFIHKQYSKEDSLFVRNILPSYYNELKEAVKTNNFKTADEYINYIKVFQNTYGKDVIIEKNKIEAEILYNKLNIFVKLFTFYWLVGILLIILTIISIFKRYKLLIIFHKILEVFVGILWLAHTLNLMLRWYIAGYPPWSNGYEMIIMVSWAILFFALLFRTKNPFVLALGSLFTGTLLFVSYLDWLNPEITNLMPVLKSYWLKIHVAIIVSSYAPLALSAIIGLMTLVLMIIKTENSKIHIKELTIINELSMIIGIFMLTIGTFLGGIWANESWGRYWAWDPKETWALISIIIYAIVLHLRLIPNLMNKYIFNLSSIIAFFSILMTSYGVNYYLSGLHSYAKGDALPIPIFVYYLISLIILISITAGIRNRKVNG